jgi:sugar phosphate isomerase/epimerase
MLDIYHAQIGEGNLVELINKCAPYIGEVQVADVSGRCEPGTGEINYSRIAQALRDVGYVGTVGLEAWASGDRNGAGAIPRRVHADASAISRWITSVMCVSRCLVSHLEMDDECICVLPEGFSTQGE